MLTKLEIVNAALAAVGLKSVLSLDTAHPSVVKAINTYNRVYSRFLAKGWYFNEYYRTFVPDVNGEITVPTGALTINFNCQDYIVRGNRVVDRRTGLLNIGTSLTGEYIEYLDVSDIPPIARTAFTDEYVYRFYLDEDGVEPKLSHYRNSAMLSSAELGAEDLKHRPVNFFNRPDRDVSYVTAGRRIR